MQAERSLYDIKAQREQSYREQMAPTDIYYNDGSTCFQIALFDVMLQVQHIYITPSVGITKRQLLPSSEK